MAQEALLKAIEEDARAQCERIVEEAEGLARAVTGEAEEEVLTLRTEGLKSLSERMERRRASLVNRARIRSRALTLRARLDIMEVVLEEAVKRIMGLPREKYRELLVRLYAELERVWEAEGGGKDTPVVLASPEDAAFLRETGREARPDPGVSLGVVFTTGDGRKRYENTVPARMKKAREMIVAGLDRLIFS